MGGQKIEKSQGSPMALEGLNSLKQQIEAKKASENLTPDSTHSKVVGHLDALIEGMGSHERDPREAEALTHLGKKFAQDYDLTRLEKLGGSDIFQRVDVANAHPAQADLATKALLLASKNEFKDPDGLEGIANKVGPWQEAARLALPLKQGVDPVEVLGNVA